MSSKQRIVAELGRPETPQESADRKAKASADHRKHQTAPNLVYSLLAVLLAVVVIALFVPRVDTDLKEPVDYRAVAEQTEQSAPGALAVPDLPESWQANAATIRDRSGVTVWHIGFITPDNEYVSLDQAFDTDKTWLAEHVPATSAHPVTVAKSTWRQHPGVEGDDDSHTTLVLSGDHTTLIVSGTAPVDDLIAVAEAIDLTAMKS